MTLTISLPPEAEQRLREKAEREGQDTADAAAAMLVQALEWEAWDRADAVRGIQQGLDDFEAGRYRPFSEFAEEQRRKYNLPPEE